MSRQIFESPIWQDVIKFRLFFFIVGNAVFSEDGVRVGSVTLQRGQFLRSYRNLASDLEFMENRSMKKHAISVLKRKVDQLIAEGRLEVEDTELGTLFTVVNYDTYQGFGNYKKPTENDKRTEREQFENVPRTEQEQNENNNKNDINVKKDKNDNNVKENSRKRVYDEESPPFILADYFYKQILKNDPKRQKPNLQNWSDDIRLMIERDDRDKKEIGELMRWVQQDEFEKANVLSPSKLRKRYTSLLLKMKSSNSSGGVKKTTPPNYKVEEVNTNEKRNEQDSGPFGPVRLFR